jgi:hypothetical protein
MGEKPTGKTLAKFEAKRDIWQEVLDGVREIKTGGGKRTNVAAKSYTVGVRFTTQLYSDPYSSPRFSLKQQHNRCPKSLQACRPSGRDDANS